LIWTGGIFGFDCLLKLSIQSLDLSVQSLDLSVQSHYLRLPLLDFGIGLFYCAFTFCSRLIGRIEFFFQIRNYTFKLGVSRPDCAQVFL